MSAEQPSFKHVCTSGVAVTTFGVLPLFLTGGLSIQIRESIAMSRGSYGAAVAMYFVASALSSVWMGRAAERIGSRSGQRLACLLTTISLLSIALWARTPITLAASLAIGGLSNSISQVSTNLAIAQLVTEGRKGFAFGIKQASIPAATLLGGIAVPIIGLSIGWRWAFGLAALPPMLLWVAVPEGALHDSPAALAATRRPGRHGPLVLLAIAAAFGSGAGNAIGVFFVDSTVSIGFEEGTAGLLFALGGALCLSSRTMLGWRADKWRGGRLLVVGWMFVAGSIGYALLATGHSFLLLPALILTFGAGWAWPGLLNFAVVLQNMDAPAAATGITQTGAYVGGIAGSFVFGQVIQHTSYAIAWTVAATWAIAAAAFCLMARMLYLHVSRDDRPLIN